MAAKYNFNIQGIEFNSKKALTDYVKAILDRNTRKLKISGLDASFLTEFFVTLHPDGAKRITENTNFSHFSVGKSEHKAAKNSNQMVFYTNFKEPISIRRRKKTRLPISYVNTIADIGKDPIQKQRAQFLEAARSAIRHQTKNFKMHVLRQQSLSNVNLPTGYGECQMTGKLTPVNELHVDHIHPKSFLWILDKFVTSNNIDFVQLEFGQSTRGMRFFKDKNIARRWRAYHLKVCEFQLINKIDNMSMGGINESLVQIPEQYKDLIDQD